MEKLKVVVAGIGGKGVLLTSRVIVEAALYKGMPAISSDEIGMSQRGGSVTSHIKLGGFSSPMVGSGTADLLVALHPEEGLRNLPLVKPGGSVVFNASPSFALPDSVLGILKDMNCALYAVDGDGISLSFNFPKGSNMAVLGAISRFSLLPFSKEELESVISKVVPDRFVSLNLKLFHRGYEEGRRIE